MVGVLIPFNLSWSGLWGICSRGEGWHGLWVNAGDVYCLCAGFHFLDANLCTQN